MLICYFNDNSFTGLFLLVWIISIRLTFKIEDGEIFATINQKDGMVSFHDNPEKFNNLAMLVHLDKEVSWLLLEVTQ